VADLAGVDAEGGSTFSGEADADYTVTVPTVALPLVLGAGQMAIVIAELTVKDSSTPLNPVEYGMAVFYSVAATRVQSNKKVNQNQQTMTFILTGPVSDGLILKMTAVPGTSSVVSSSLIAAVLNG